MVVLLAGKPTVPGLSPSCGQMMEGVLVAGEVAGHWPGTPEQATKPPNPQTGLFYELVTYPSPAG